MSWAGSYGNRERKPKRLNRFRIIGKSIIAAYVQKYKENNAPFTHTHTHTSIYLSIYINLPVHALTCKSTHLFPLICSRRVAAKRWQKKQVIEAVWQQELKINDSNFHSILIASKKANHEALYNAAISYVARNLKRLKSTKAFQNLQKEPEILISILEQAKSQICDNFALYAMKYQDEVRPYIRIYFDHYDFDN